MTLNDPPKDKNGIPLDSTKPRKQRKRNYINNREMYDVLVIWLDECEANEAKGELAPQIPRYLAECFMQISNRLGTKSNFSGYTFLEDMKGDALINCVKYCRNFNPKYTNPFAYFTQYVKNAFIQRILKEKANLYSRYKIYQDLQLLDQLNGTEGIGSPELNDITNSYIASFETTLQNNKKKYHSRRVSDRENIANTVTDFFDKDIDKSRK